MQMLKIFMYIISLLPNDSVHLVTETVGKAVGEKVVRTAKNFPKNSVVPSAPKVDVLAQIQESAVIYGVQGAVQVPNKEIALPVRISTTTVFAPQNVHLCRPTTPLHILGK